MANSAEGVVLMAEEPRGWRMRGVGGVGVKKVRNSTYWRRRQDLASSTGPLYVAVVRAIL